MLALITLTTLAVNVMTLAGMRRVQRREVTFGAEWVTKEHCRDQCATQLAHINSVERRFEGLQAERRADVGLLHDKVNKVDRCTASLQASLDQVNVRMAQIDAKLDRAIERRQG